jgi:hypothetical protein
MEFSYKPVYILGRENFVTLPAQSFAHSLQRVIQAASLNSRTTSKRPQFDTGLRRLIKSIGWTWRQLFPCESRLAEFWPVRWRFLRSLPRGGVAQVVRATVS